MNTREVFDTAPSRDARFWDRIAGRYAAKPVADEAAYQTKLEITRGYLSPDAEVVELGCGTGSTALVHAPHVGHVLATDLSPEMIGIARRKARDAGIGNVTFRVASVEALDLPGESVDAVLALSVLHLLRDPEAAIAKAWAMLRPGGVFVSSTACLGDGMRWFALVAPVGRALRLMPFVKVMKAGDLRDALTRQGFTIGHDWQPGDGRTLFVVARKPC